MKKFFSFLVMSGLGLSACGGLGAQVSGLDEPTFAKGYENIDRSADGPWQHDLGIAFSQDGVNFSSSETFLEGAGVASLVERPDGVLVAIYQWFPESEWFDYPAVSFSEDEGHTWTDPEPIQMYNYPKNLENPFDPAFALLDDGRLRLYFTSTTGHGHSMETADTQIYSAISEDGLVYTYEEGVRFEDENQNFTRDSAVAFLDGVWHLFTPDNDNVDAMSHATSEDGLEFTDQGDVSVNDEEMTLLGAALKWGEKLRFYGSYMGQMAYTESEDGRTWSSPRQTNLMGADPAVVQTSAGNYVAIFTSIEMPDDFGGFQEGPGGFEPGGPGEGMMPPFDGPGY